MRIVLAVVAAILVAVLALRSAAADSPPAVTSMTIDSPDHLTIGDRITVRIAVDAPQRTKLTFVPGSLTQTLALVGTPAVTSSGAVNGRAQLEMSLTLAVFGTGDVDVPPLTLHYTDPAGAAGDLTTHAARLSVDSVLPTSGDLTPRDLKPQFEVGSAPLPAWIIPTLVGVAVLTVVAAGAAVWRRRRVRRRPPLPVAPEPAGVGPEDRARGALDAVGASLTSGDYASGYATIAGTVRGYLTDRFGFPAFALTTRELQDQMVRRGIEHWQARVVGGLLEQCDAVVYASYRPAAERADADLTAAYEIVEMARPEALVEDKAAEVLP